MIVWLRRHAPAGAAALLISKLAASGYQSSRCRLDGRLVLVLRQADGRGAEPALCWADAIAVVDEIGDVVERWFPADAGSTIELASLAAAGCRSTVRAGQYAAFGDGDFAVIAGPCAVEDPLQLNAVARTVAGLGATVLRGGAFKPRTSPYAFQGLGPAGLEMLRQAREVSGLATVTEVITPADVERVGAAVDIVQVGARNAQNFALLTEIGRAGLPVLLKRGFGCTVDEWLQAAEYVLKEGNPSVVLCERGIRSFEPGTRFTLDISAVPRLRQLTHLPVVVDPSHAAGHRDLVAPLALAAAAAGADGVMIDVHPSPAGARCDAAQAMVPAEFELLMGRLEAMLASLGRRLAGAAAAVRTGAVTVSA